MVGEVAVIMPTDLSDTLASSYKAFLEGRRDEAAKGFRYLAALGATLPRPDEDLAILARDGGARDEALALWVKSSLLPEADGFVWNQRGWSYLSANRLEQAKDSFLKAVDRSTTTASQAEANLGLGLAALADGKPKGAMAPLRSALVQGPYVVPAASYATALTALAMGDRQAALAYLRQAADLDPLDMESQRALARLEEQVGENRPAWRAYIRLLSFDPADDEALKRSAKLARFISGDPNTSLPTRRLNRPLLDPGIEDPAPKISTATVRVALFSAPDGRPATLKSFFFIANGDFKLVLSGSGETVKDDGKGESQWEVLFRPETSLVEVRDTSHNIQYTSKQPFKIVPAPRGGSTLVKSVVFERPPVGFDAGDRELRGALEVLPTPSGFKLLNEAGVEDYLRGVVGGALPQGSPLEAYKAEAVVARTYALWRKAYAEPNLERSDLCDSPSACQRYLGVNEEMRQASEAVLQTEGWVLTLDDRLTLVLQHENCGGRTEAGADVSPALKQLVSVNDSVSSAWLPRTPAELERWTHEFPPRDIFCDAGNRASPAQSRWIRLLDAAELRRRAERVRAIGPVVAMRAAKRTPSGRIQVLEIEGTRDRLVLEGERAISDVLSPGSLRSTLFTITPLMKGSHVERFILWGAGTGSGLGLCQAGAVGQAGLGRDWRAILASYFPALKLERLSSAPIASAAHSGKRHPLNPRRKKTAGP